MNILKYNNLQTLALVTLRVFIGWHFLYEGLVKVFNPSWSAASFLNNAQGPFEGFFKGLVSDSFVLESINLLNQWALVLIGLSLLLGLFSKAGTLAGMALLFLYYISNPPFIGLETPPQAEGSYLIVNKNLIEMAALFVLLIFPSSTKIGLDRLIFRENKKRYIL